jgi:ankyrin repeat protein
LHIINYLDITNVVCSPEGKYPLMLAIEKNQESIVNFLLKIGAECSLSDPAGNNAVSINIPRISIANQITSTLQFHYAALVSKEMLEILWNEEKCKHLLNAKNNDGDTPTRVAFTNLNPLCLRTLLNYGGEMRRASDKNALFELMQSKGRTIE